MNTQSQTVAGEPRGIRTMKFQEQSRKPVSQNSPATDSIIPDNGHDAKQGVSDDALLGSITNYASTEEKPEPEYVPDYCYQYGLLDAAQQLFALKKHRVTNCRKLRIDKEQPIQIRVDSQNNRAGYSNIQSCGNVWACPVCSARITEERRLEVQRAVHEWKKRGKHVAMLTCTVRHNKSQSAKDVLKNFNRIWRKFTSGRAWQDSKSDYGLIGTIRALETTYGSNGWHVHVHALLFLDVELNTDTRHLEAFYKQRWTDSSRYYRAFASAKHGCTLTSHADDIAAYVTKYGKLPRDMDEKLEDASTTWNESHEVTKHTTKKASTSTGRTPFQLLHDYKHENDKRAGQLFMEYAFAFAGKRQLNWSNGLKDMLLVEEVEDENVLENLPEETIEEIRIVVWREIIRQKQRGTVLAAALAGKQALDELLAEVENRIECGLTFTIKTVQAGHYIWISESRQGYRYHVWSLADTTKRKPDHESNVYLPTENEAYFLACKLSNHLEKMQ